MVTMAKTRLTKQHRELIEEINELLSELDLDPVVLTKRTKDRTRYLQRARNELSGHLVISQYLVMEEVLNIIISRYFFGKKYSMKRYMNNPIYVTFHYFVLEKLYFLQKLELFEQIYPLPKNLRSTLRTLNDVRNGIAHSLSPEKRKRNKPLWRGESVFTATGKGLFYDDMLKVVDYFERHFPFLISVSSKESAMAAKHQGKASG
jgi:hypothetical protein